MRQHYSNEVSIRLVKKSLAFFQSFPDEFDGADVFTSTGWLFLVPPEAADVFDVNIARLRQEGVKTWAISVEDAVEEIPGLNTDGIARVAFEPESGYVDPGAMVRALAAKGESNGGQVRARSPVTGIATNGSVSRVSTPSGDVEARVVVNAAGPWAYRVGRWMGLDLPLELSREQDIVVRPPDGAPELRRCISNMVDRTYIRPAQGGTVLAGTGHPKEKRARRPGLVPEGRRRGVRAGDKQAPSPSPPCTVRRRGRAWMGGPLYHNPRLEHDTRPLARQREPLPGRRRQRPLLQDRSGHGPVPGGDDSRRQR